jgi:hypothetical protein
MRANTYTVRPLTPALWPQLEALLGRVGACNGCWCMYWRIGSAYRKRRELNKEEFQQIVRHGPPPGLVAFDGDLAIGWCQVTPRSDLPWLDRTWRLRRVDDVPVWSISCLYTRIGYRKKGVTRQCPSLLLLRLGETHLTEGAFLFFRSMHEKVSEHQRSSRNCQY